MNEAVRVTSDEEPVMTRSQAWQLWKAAALFPDGTPTRFAELLEDLGVGQPTLGSSKFGQGDAVWFLRQWSEAMCSEDLAT